MKREELRAKLDELKIPYNARLGDVKLNELLVEHLAAEVSEETAAQPEAAKAAELEATESEADATAETTTEPQLSEEQIQAVADDITGKGKTSLEEALEGTQRVDGDGAVTKSGILIPSEVLQKIPRAAYIWRAECTTDRCHVSKRGANGKDTFVREYSLEIHGEDFAGLAKQIVDKNNK